MKYTWGSGQCLTHPWWNYWNTVTLNLQVCNRERYVSNIQRVIDYIDRGFRGFTQSLHTTAGTANGADLYVLFNSSSIIHEQPKFRRHTFWVMTAWLNDPHKNFIGALVFLLKVPSNLAPFSQSLSPSIGSPDTTLTSEYFCAGAGFSSDIAIRRKCYSLEM
jgi:hypothetical protein